MTETSSATDRRWDFCRCSSRGFEEREFLDWTSLRCSNSSTVLQNQLSYPATHHPLSLIVSLTHFKSFFHSVLFVLDDEVGAAAGGGTLPGPGTITVFCSAVCFGGESQLGRTGDTSCASTASHITKVVSRDFACLWFIWISHVDACWREVKNKRCFFGSWCFRCCVSE